VTAPQSAVGKGLALCLERRYFRTGVLSAAECKDF
jgi:hypothetical protein